MVLPGQAQTAVRISSSLSARAIGAGQQAVLSYQITGPVGSIEEFPSVIEVPGLTIEYSGQSQRIAMRNGETLAEYAFRYTVSANEKGDYEIPPQFFKVDGAQLEGPSVKVTVTEAAAPVEDEFTPNVQLTVGKTEFWKGEVVPVQVAILVHPAVQPLSPFFPQVRTPNFAVNRFDRSAGLEAREINGEVWRAWQMDSVMTALQAGAQTFGPAEFKAELLIPDAGFRRDAFGRAQGSKSTRALTSNVISVNVKELPLEGKPADFSGAVGEFEIDLAASPVELSAGDPIAVEIGITGTGNFDALTPPTMASVDGWRLYAPRVSQENRTWGTEPGRKSFTQILIPEKNQTEIPPFVLTFFNPSTGTYVTKKSEPIAIMVKGEFKAANGTGVEARDFAIPADASAPFEELGDILAQPLLQKPGAAWLATAAAPLPTNRAFLHGVPALLVLLLIGEGIRRRWKAAAEARRPLPGTPREPYLVLADLRRPGQSRRAFYTLVNEYLTSTEFHHQRRPTSSDVMQDLLGERDRWLYGPSEAEASEPVPDAAQRLALDTLNRP